MTRLLVEIDDFVDAARTLDEQVGDPIDTAVARLSSALGACGGMAGDDPPAREWARSYDAAALAALRATSRVAAAAYATSAMFGRSAVNYARAEAASTTGGASVSSALSRLPGHPLLVPASAPPGAAGGGGGEPSGWGLVKDLVGYVWPNGHQDRLRAAAGAHRRCADALDDAAIRPVVAGVGFARDRLPEADDVLTVCQGLTERIRELASAHRSLARMCDEFADHLDECHSEVESELSELGIESGVIQGIGAGLSVFTFGGAEVPTQGVQAARLASVAARVGGLISTCGTAVRTLADTLPEVAAVSDRIARALEGLSGARLAYAGVTEVPRLQRAERMAMEGREAASTSRLAQDSRRILRTPKRMIGRKPGDPGVWGDSSTLASHFERHGAEVGARNAKEYMSKASDLLQRALRGEVPAKIDNRGVIRVFNPATREFGSFRPDGSTRTFYKATTKYFEKQRGTLQ